MMWFIFTEGTYNMVFFACLYMLRDIEDQFNINRELKEVIVFKFFADFLYAGSLIFMHESFFVVLGFGEYI